MKNINIKIKTEAEIEKMAVAGKLAAEVLEMIEEYVVAGVSTATLNNICHQYITEQQHAIPAPLNYRGFPKSICTSINHVICHGIPSTDKILKKGDIINIDITVIKDGWHGDTSKMFYIGEPSIIAKRLVTTTQEALYNAIAKVKPGNTLNDIAREIEKVAKRERFSIVREYCGHGIGKIFHEDPQVLHYVCNENEIELKPGMVFTIEPMLNEGSRYNSLLADNWTVITKDRKLSAQWEHTIAVTNYGYKILTKRHDEIGL
jgi:methionyl aminopeptidase